MIFVTFARPNQFEFVNMAEIVFLSDTCRPMHIFDVYTKVQYPYFRSACSYSSVLATTVGSAFERLLLLHDIGVLAAEASP